MRRPALIISLVIMLMGLFLFLNQKKIINLGIDFPEIAQTINRFRKINPDIEPQHPLINPPAEIKAVYMTSWSAGNETKLKYLTNLIKETELNSVVIDVKDFSGYVAYNTNLELPKKYNAVELRIPRLNALIKRLHDQNIYVIGRISVFQDQRLAKARPDLALFSSSTQSSWTDYKGLTWIDVAAKESWDYNIAVAKEILERGFDEVNFDYIRFASDGNLKDIQYPVWDGKNLKTHMVRDFFQYLREQLHNAKISADLFGLVTINTDGLGIGQHLEYALPYFDAIAPMVYPSHYFKGFIGYEKPAEFPYEVVKRSMDTALARIKKYELKIKNAIGNSTTTAIMMPKIAKLRPWLQDFDLGADYDDKKVRSQIQAWYDSATTTKKYYDGWMIWNARNIYTKAALLNEPLAAGQ